MIISHATLQLQPKANFQQSLISQGAAGSGFIHVLDVTLMAFLTPLIQTWDWYLECFWCPEVGFMSPPSLKLGIGLSKPLGDWWWLHPSFMYSLCDKRRRQTWLWEHVRSCSCKDCWLALIWTCEPTRSRKHSYRLFCCSTVTDISLFN